MMSEDLAECCKKTDVAPKTIKRSVPTRWNSVAEMLRSAIHLHPALDKLVLLDRHNTNVKSRLKQYKLKKDEWDVLSQLEPILVVRHIIIKIFVDPYLHLQAFLVATERMSQNKVPLLHEVIPIIDVLTDKLEMSAMDQKLHVTVRATAAKGLAVLNKYYAKTDDSIMYRMAMSTSFHLLVG